MCYDRIVKRKRRSDAMLFYDCYGNEYEFDLSNKVGNGNCGEIYRYDSEWVLKYYYDTCCDDYRLRKGIYDIIQEIKSPYIAEVKDLLFKEKINDDVSDLDFFFDKHVIDAYTCRYIRPDNIDILTTSTDYLVDNMNELSKLFFEFAKYDIGTFDVKPDNAIVQSDKIVLIDLDLFKKSRVSGDELEEMNQKRLLHFIRCLLMDCMLAYGYHRDLISSMNYMFRNIRYNSGANVVLEVAKEFQKYKYPIDCIKEYKKK